MKTALADLLSTRTPVIADGAMGTNLFAAGLEAGEAPELWNVDHPDRILALHRAFVAAGSDIILTNSFGANRFRLALHGDEDRVAELASASARLARQAADEVERPVVVAGSVGPTGSLMVPLGELTPDDAVAAFTEQMTALTDGGVDVIWIETMSAAEEMRAAAEAAISIGMPYVVTASFDTAGKTMMGLTPSDLPGVFDGLAVAPLAVGSNCGVGASDILVSTLALSDAVSGDASEVNVTVKGNCGVPEFVGTEIVYAETPETMAEYARLAVDAGADIIGGCCGTTPTHVAAMHDAVEQHSRRPAPSIDTIEATTGPLVNAAPGDNAAADEAAAGRRRRRRDNRGD